MKKYFTILGTALAIALGTAFALSQLAKITKDQASNNALDANDSAESAPSTAPSCLSAEQIAQIDGAACDFQNQIVAEAQARTQFDVRYIDQYYSSNGGKPPDHEGVCTDHFWRALEGAGVDFQEVLYTDMLAHQGSYPLHIWGMPTPNRSIDFRRVPNVDAYLKRYAQQLPLEITACNFESLQNWQPGDIVIFRINGEGTLIDHIPKISNKRNSKGIPYLLHNYGRGEVEEDGTNWYPRAAGHYRLTGVQ